MVGHFSWFFLLAFIGVNVLSTFAADVDKDTCGGICMKVLGKSGKVAIVRCGKGKRKDYGEANYGKAFTIEVNYVKQVDKNDTSVGKAVNSFAKQDFTLSNLNRSASLQGIKAVHLDLKAYLKEPEAWLSVSAYIFCEEGNFTFGEETFGVQNGTLKIFLKLSNYTFCDGNNTSPCKKDEVGEDAEIGLVVKSRGGKPPKREDDKEGDGGKKNNERMPCRSKDPKKCKNRRKYKFGDGEDGDEMVAASKCKKDGKFANMSGDFPKVVTKGGKQVLVFRVPKFVDFVELDPGVTIGESDVDDDDDDDDDGDDKDNASSIQLNVFMFVVMVSAFFSFM